MAAVDPKPPASRIEAEVRRARALLEQRQLAQALAAAQALLAEVPQNRDVLYLIAVSQRYLGCIASALTTLARFEAIHPDYGRLFQERGHCYRALGETGCRDRGLSAGRYSQPDIVGQLECTQRTLAALDRNAEAEDAAARAAKLASLPPPVVSATNLLVEGEIYAAEQMVRQFLQTDGTHVEGMRLLAQIAAKLDILDDAEFLLESVLVFEPDYHAARFEYAGVLAQRHKYARARQEIQKLQSVAPAHRGYLTSYANACVGLGDHEEALRVYQELLADMPRAPELHLSIAHILKTIGRLPEAIESYRAAARVQPALVTHIGVSPT